jgi:hypothetical protein
VNVDRLAHLLETEQYRLVPVDELGRLLDRTVRDRLLHGRPVARLTRHEENLVALSLRCRCGASYALIAKLMPILSDGPIRSETVWRKRLRALGAVPQLHGGRDPLAAAEKARESRRVWTDDLVVDAIRAWADWKGRPPIEEDWRRRRTADEPRRPASSTVARVLGSWDAGLAAAGYPSRRERLVAA